MRTTTGWRATGPNRLELAAIERRDLRPDDVAVRVEYCGVCHSDLQALRDHTGPAPLVPGHEFTDVVSEIGVEVTSLRIGDPVAVENIVDSCGECGMCALGQENFCHEFPTLTYSGTDRHDSSITVGAYSREYVVRVAFASRLPDVLDPVSAAPLMCTRVAVWGRMRALRMGWHTRVAVVSLGGLYHL